MTLAYDDIADKVQSELVVDDIRLVILKPQQKRGGESNLLGFGPNGNALWQLDAPMNTPQFWDGYIALTIQAGQVWVNSWSGCERRIDHRTGKVLEEMFTK